MTIEAQTYNGPDRTPMIEAQRLTLRRGMRDVIHALDLTVMAGTALIIRGANGSGKTTLLRGLAGLLHPFDGTITINETRMDEDRMTVLSCLTFIGHRDGGASTLTARENLRFWADTRSGKTTISDVTIQEALAVFGMERSADTPLYMMSEGQRKRCGLARLMLVDGAVHSNTGAHHGKVWLLDEPLTALDKASIDATLAVINRFTDAGGTAVIATHHDMDLTHGDVMQLAGAGQ